MPPRKPKTRTPKASRPHMPGYGLPKGTKGLLPWRWGMDRLRKSHNYWIATIRSDGRPHLMPIWGLWIDGVFYFSTGSGSRKAKNLAVNPKCVIATENAAETVVLEGSARVVADLKTRRRFIRDCERKYKFDMSAFEGDILNLKEPIYAVVPAVAFGLDEKKTLNTATRWRFAK